MFTGALLIAYCVVLGTEGNIAVLLCVNVCWCIGDILMCGFGN
jgi:hypothetical protein